MDRVILFPSVRGYPTAKILGKSVPIRSHVFGITAIKCWEIFKKVVFYLDSNNFGKSIKYNLSIESSESYSDPEYSYLFVIILGSITREGEEKGVILD